jgi:hypothetical protein
MLAEPSVFSSAVEKHKNQNKQDHNFAHGSVWVWNLVSDIKGGAQTEGVWEQGAQDDIWTPRDEWREVGENFITRSFMICTQVSLEWSSLWGWDGWSM